MKTTTSLPLAVILFNISGYVSAILSNDQTPPNQQAVCVGQSVKTTSGTIIGHAAKHRTQVSEYLGIPFAKPPTGELRFAAPLKYQSNDVMNASRYSLDCPSTFIDATTIAHLDPAALGAFLSAISGTNALELLMQLGQAGNNQGEDCLGLNIWTKPQTGEKHKAVLVWIYGGGFESGSTNDPIYDGEYIADNQDVVVVSTNYRTNVFGFPGIPDVDGVSQNPGLLDQRLAVEWVRDNIAEFGGDPDRITLFGQSAGGASVDYYSYAWTDDPIVHALIAESGTATSFSDPPPSDNSEAWFNATAKLGCGGPTVNPAQSVECMRSKTYQELLNATRAASPLQAILGNFGPTADEEVVFSDYETRAAHGDFLRVPYLMGNNNYEAGLFRLIALAAGQNFPDAAWCIFNLDIFTCPSSAAARSRVQNHVQTYRYRYYGEFRNLRLTSNPNSGTWHGSEIPIIFGTAEDASRSPNTPAENSISKYLQAAWANFAKDPETAFTESRYLFPTYNPFTRSLVEFALDNQTLPSFAYPATRDAICPAIEFFDSQIPGGLIGAVTSGMNFQQIIDEFSGSLGPLGMGNLTALINGLLLTNGTKCAY